MCISTAQGIPIPTYTNVVVQLNPSRGVQLHFFQSLPDNIVWLSLACLGGLDCSSFVNVSFVVDVELAEGILQAEDLVLLELRVFPALRRVSIGSLLLRP
jgi:hypothetical protein